MTACFAFLRQDVTALQRELDYIRRVSSEVFDEFPADLFDEDERDRMLSAVRSVWAWRSKDLEPRVKATMLQAENVKDLFREGVQAYLVMTTDKGESR